MQSFKKNHLIFILYTKFRRLLTIVSPKLNTIVTFPISKGRPVNLKNQNLRRKDFMVKTEHILQKPLISKCADKYAVREYVSSCGLGEILNELYGVYDRVEDINWEDLPDKFALKWNNGCGFNIFCHDKKEFRYR